MLCAAVVAAAHQLCQCWATGQLWFSVNFVGLLLWRVAAFGSLRIDFNLLMLLALQAVVGHVNF